MTDDNTLAIQVIIYVFIVFIQYAIIGCIIRCCARSIIREEMQKLNNPNCPSNLAYT